MDTRFLESFVVVATSGSFAEAARRLNLTATAVSQRVRVLEAELGVKLVTRVGRTIRPTEAGAAVCNKAANFLSQLRDLRTIYTDAQVVGELRIGAISTILTGLLPRALAALVKVNPGVEVHITPGSSSDLYHKVLRQELDAALIMQPPFDLPKVCDWVELRREPLLLLTAEEVEAADTNTILRTHPFIRCDRSTWGGQQIDRYLRDHEIYPDERFELDTLEVIATLVDANLGVALVPDWPSPWPGGLSLRRQVISNSRYARRIGILWTRSGARDRLIKMLIDCIGIMV